MGVTYDGDSDAVRFDLTEDGEAVEPANTSRLPSPSGGTFVFDYDEDGNLLTVGFLGASKIMDPAILRDEGEDS